MERTGSVGSAPALDFCLEHINDDFAGDPHTSAPSASAAAAAATTAVSHATSSDVSKGGVRPPLSPAADAADVHVTIDSASSSIEKSSMIQVADAIVSVTAQTAAAPLRALSASLNFKRTTSSSSSTRLHPSHSSSLARSISEAEAGDIAACATLGADDLNTIVARRTRSAPAASVATSDIPTIRPASVTVQRHERSPSASDTRAAPSPLQRFASAGRAAVAAVDTAISGVFKDAPPFMCIICSDDFPVELRCALPCNSPTCTDA